MNKRSIQLGVAVLALTLTALACSFSFSQPETRNLRVSKDQEGNQTATQFNPEDSIFLVGDLPDASDGTNFKTRWIAVSAEGLDANKLFWEHEEERDNGKFFIKLPTDVGPRPAGKYKIEIYLNSELDRSIDFEVLKGQPTPTPPMPSGAGDPGAIPGAAGVENVHTSRDETDAQPTSAFAQSDIIFVHFLLNSAEGQAQYNAILSAASVEGLEPGYRLAEAQATGGNGPQWVRFSSNLPWHMGVYRIDLAVNNTPVQALQVEVIPTNNNGAQVTNPFVTLDQEGQLPVTVFPSNNDTIYVQFTLANAPGEIPVKGLLVARDAAGLEPNSAVNSTSASIADGSYVFSFPTDSPWPLGNYSVFIYLNGQVASSIDLQVQ